MTTYVKGTSAACEGNRVPQHNYTPRRRPDGHDPLRAAFPQYLRSRRAAEKLTRPQLDARIQTILRQRKLTSSVSVGVHSLEKYENGTRLPTGPVMAVLFEALNVNDRSRDRIRYLWAPDRPAAPNSPPVLIDSDLRLLKSMMVPAVYLEESTLTVLHANPALFEALPGLCAGASLVEWFLLEPIARLLVVNWRQYTHSLIATVRDSHLDAHNDEPFLRLKRRCSSAPEFSGFWDVDPPEGHAPVLCIRDMTTRTAHRFETHHLKLDDKRVTLFTMTLVDPSNSANDADHHDTTPLPMWPASQRH